MAGSVSAQTELLKKCFAIYQEQNEKAMKFQADSASKAMANGQKTLQEWADSTTELGGDTRTAFKAHVKEASKAFTPVA